jgi:hypothetical protein
MLRNITYIHLLVFLIFRLWPRPAKSPIILDLSVYLTRGPDKDATHLKNVLDHVQPDLKIEHMPTDAGYDCETTHVWGREKLGIIHSSNRITQTKRTSAKVLRLHGHRLRSFNLQNLTAGRNNTVLILYLLKKFSQSRNL